MAQKETATLAGGCFWCTEAIFKRLKGVTSVTSGYANAEETDGKISYAQVSSGETGSAEAIQVVFDPSRISFEKLLEVFWHMIDPTTLNRQGADTGTQYRSAIFYHNETQKQIAESSKEKADASGAYKDPIVTEITPFMNFYNAEEYHQDYFEKNQGIPYCNIVINPKIQKLVELYNKDLKEEYLPK